MTRNLKTMVLTGMAIAAFGTLSASVAQASGEYYSCSVEPCSLKVSADGTGKTTHQVLDFKVNAGNLTTVTCNSVTGDATSSTGKTSEITLTGISYGECNVGGQKATTNMNGCHYLLTAGTEGTVHVQCPLVSPGIQIVFGACVATVGPQTLSGINYNNILGIVTVESSVSGIHGTTNAGCPGGAGTFTTGELTTGNALVTGQTDPGGVMASIFCESSSETC
jgi:hypothetical protein